MTTLSAAAAVAPPEELVALVRGTAPVASVYVGAPEPTDVDRLAFGLRWEALRTRLESLGAPAPDLQALDGWLAGVRPGDVVHAGFAAAGSLTLTAEMADSDEPDSATYGPNPRLVPLLRWGQQRVPYVVAVVHHGRAELSAFDARGRLVSAEGALGPDDEIELNAPGGWSQARYQRRAMDSWAHNAGAFAERIARLAETVQAQLLVLSGDVREVHLVADRLPHSVDRIARLAPSLPRDPTFGVDPTVVRELVAGVVADGRRLAVEEYDEAVGRRLAVEGPADVSRHLDAGGVRRLFVVHDVASPELVDALTAAALAADADVVVLEPGDAALVGGVGAQLRF